MFKTIFTAIACVRVIVGLVFIDWHYIPPLRILRGSCCRKNEKTFNRSVFVVALPIRIGFNSLYGLPAPTVGGVNKQQGVQNYGSKDPEDEGPDYRKNR